MAHHVEPMDIDSDFDNKENSLHHNNVLPFTEKGYEELDVSELNMKLRYSITPASSPMSKSYTANCLDNRSLESGDDSHNVTVNENSNLTRSLNSTMTQNDKILKSLKALPLKALSTEQFDNNRSSVLRPLDTTITEDNANVTVTVSGPTDVDENLSLPSTSSSALQTPEATTPTKDIQKTDGGSPIMRGLKSVFNMFRSSQSPIPPADSDSTSKPDLLSAAEPPVIIEEAKSEVMLASTPISAHRKKETSPTKRSSPYKESIVFNEDLEKELQWKDETTIIFSQERIPIHKLFFQPTQTDNINIKANQEMEQSKQNVQDDMNSTVEYMDISYNDSIRDRTMTDIQVIGNRSDFTVAGESDGEFLDCETTFTKNESILEDKDKTPVIDNTQDLDLTKDIDYTKNTSGSRLRQIILNTTQDILDATLSITPEDLIPEALIKKEDISRQTPLPEDPKPNEIELEKVNESIKTMVCVGKLENTLTSEEIIPALDQTVHNVNPSENVTKSTEYDIQPVLDQKLNINSSQENTEDKVDSISKAVENIPVETTDESDDQPSLTECVEATSSSETIVQGVDVNEDPARKEKEGSTNDSVTDFTCNATQDIVLNKTVNATEIIEHNTVNTTENPAPILEAMIQPIHTHVEVESSLVKEASMTELPADIPLPDEDDLEKELDIPMSMTPEVSDTPVNLPLDLVDDIKVKSEVPEVIEATGLLEEETVKESENKTILSEVLPPHDSHNSENGIDVLLDQDQEEIKVIQVNNEHSDVENDKLITSEGQQIVTINELPETKSKVEQVPDCVEAINIASTASECLNTTVTCNNEQHVPQSQEILPMDINASVIEFKPLPDIINLTISMSNGENIKTTNIPESVVLEQSAVVLENLEKEVVEAIVPEVINKVEPQLASDANICEIENPIKDEPSITPAIEEINKHSDTNITESGLTDNLTVAQKIIDEQTSTLDVSLKEPVISENENQDADEVVSEIVAIKTADEEIVVSENSSPFVVLTAEDISEMKPDNIYEVPNLDNQLEETPGKVIFTPPASPPIASKGYNFNFDEIEDPFATKTKIRLSPPLDTPTKAVEQKESPKSEEKPIPIKENNNRRKSQPERKKPAPKRKFNSTFGGVTGNTDSKDTADKPVEFFAAGDINLDAPPHVALDPNNVTTKEDRLIHEAKIIHEKTLSVTKEVLKAEQDQKIESKIEQSVDTHPVEVIENDTIEQKEIKTTSSSEHSTYYSAGTSSSESIPSRNVFNLPEIDDINFNPFATKSKMRQSPPLNIDIENPFTTKPKIRNSAELSVILPQNDDKAVQDITKVVSVDEKMENELMEKDGSINLSNTISSKATDERNATTREINTEDEDTIEGPFLEAEDLNVDEKMTEFESENIDMMQFNDMAAQGNEENLDNGELFIDAEAFEFLLNQNKSNTVVDSGKESLFLKFDPLFAKRMSSVTPDGVVASLNKIQKRQSTPTKATTSSSSHPPHKNVVSPIAGPSNLNITQDLDMSEEFNDDLNITVSKPMMVVPPAVNPVTPRNKSLTPNRSNRRSITFTSPAMAVIDRLLSLSGNSSLVHDTTVTQATREQNEADLALTQLRELLAEKEVHVYSLRTESKELKDRLTSLESHLKSLEDESQDRLKKINELNDRLAEKTKINKSMAAVVEEYERTIASLISETAQDKKRHAEERIKLINERDEQTAHLASMEVSFSDLHSKYEKSKQVILNCKANEDTYKKSIKAFEDNLTKMQNNYELLKQHATSKLNHANQELEKMNKTHEAEVLKLNAMIKRKELHITSLEESLAQKTKANEELTAICDELINKVG